MLPVVAAESGIDRLHLTRKLVEALSRGGIKTIGDLIDGQHLSPLGSEVLGRAGGRAAWAVVEELRPFCHGEDVDWAAFWASRGVAIIPNTVPGSPDVAALVRAVRCHL